ncbi:ectoine/hydroxyectoine ABC transporter permease subunit EhuD [Paenibacillus senegalensis]|uniref:ectoine/hydroxyectoine ABC transporter permease subunit EhuD n=1 Tax=Paenibacillus senegalensis TaxID=1465766 RepID=UPI0002888000|nr:ectoine/hydroxyectoine ABC transporter permease subunit EhuD [Paenibacillus senegalensis]
MWDWDYAISVLPDLLKVLPLTVAATFIGFGISVVFGLLLALMSRSSIKMVRFPAKAFVEFVRNTPLLVQIFFIYFVLPLYGISLSAFTCGVIALGLHYSTYLSEVYRSGIEAVDKGQWEASTALNFSKSQTWLRVILPQAVPPTIPVMGNYLIVMFKETPLLSAISVGELLMTAKGLGSMSFKYVELYTLIGVLFLVLSYPCSLLVRAAEKRLARK